MKTNRIIGYLLTALFLAHLTIADVAIEDPRPELTATAITDDDADGKRGAVGAVQDLYDNDLALKVFTEGLEDSLAIKLTVAQIDTLAELNAILADADLIDTTDARLSNARTPTAHNHAASEVTSGTFADARISQTSVTQHQAALVITESQISDLQAYQLAATAATDTELSNGLALKQDAATAATDAEIANMVESDVAGITGADAIANIVSLTVAEYAAITPAAGVLYIVTPNP